MYNLIEYSSNYSETTGSLWFYYKDEITNFNADIANNDDLKPSPIKLNYGANGILRNATIIGPVKYLSIIWRSLEMPLINSEVELKLKWCFAWTW